MLIDICKAHDGYDGARQYIRGSFLSLAWLWMTATAPKAKRTARRESRSIGSQVLGILQLASAAEVSFLSVELQQLCPNALLHIPEKISSLCRHKTPSSKYTFTNFQCHKTQKNRSRHKPSTMANDLMEKDTGGLVAQPFSPWLCLSAPRIASSWPCTQKPSACVSRCALPGLVFLRRVRS